MSFERYRLLFVLAVVTGLAALASLPAAGNQSGLAEVRAAVAPYHRVEAAQDAEWDFVEGLDHCFDNPGVGGMGYHLINTDLLDAEVDPRQPEALVYVPDRHGRLHLAAVEWIVPADAWAATGATEPPMLLGQHFHLNDTLGVWVLHAWIFRHNPAGMFEDWNPRVSCD
jgi:hypothetical protein